MKFVTIASLVMASLAASQSLEDLPSCSVDCVKTAVKKATDCSESDLPCICKHFDSIKGASAGCIVRECGPGTALREVRPAAEKLCYGYINNSDKPRPLPRRGESQAGTATVVPAPPETTVEPISTCAPTSSPAVTAGATVLVPIGRLAVVAVVALAM
ncbi:CFEM domain protein [Metarhizium rileyi]|uniref:CFEM domain protein n=1 Tax=Metarhizium rileyi (strain RCEF 4871) TaxID=1649241 RepID=A0A166W0X4_METRR|nr:CFEM domain protein [Metarhizium rileyi RCEF 4871]TWU70745.1 hypothetical protein ED733_000407 [Metarhizium rileyi]